MRTSIGHVRCVRKVSMSLSSVQIGNLTKILISLRANLWKIKQPTSTVAAFVLFISAALAGFAQSPTGTIRGTVQDQSGAVVVGATVSIVNNNTNETKVVTTDSAGRYILPFVPPSVYTVTTTAPGFEPEKQQNVTVQISIGRPVNFTLTVGKESQQVQVGSTTPPLEANSSTVDTVITGKQILDLPLNGRNPFQLATLAPGVSDIGGAIEQTPPATPHISGSPNANNEVELDGMTDILPENNIGNNVTAYQPIVDSIQEISVQTNVAPAEYGRFSGGNINLVTRSGTNKLHGSLFEFVQNNMFDANNYFSTTPLPSGTQYQYGGTAGAPIIVPHLYNGKDKSFFFVAFERSQATSATTEVDSVPPLDWRKGIFDGSSATIYDPKTATPIPGGGYSRSPFPDNVIPLGRMNPVGLAIMNNYPKPNTGGPNAEYNNYISTGNGTFDYYHYDIRLDHNWTPNWHTFLRFSHIESDNRPFNAWPEPYSIASPDYGPGSTTAYNLAYDNTITLSPTLVANISYGFSRYATTAFPFGPNQGAFDLRTLGLPASYAKVAAMDAEIYPNISMGNGFTSQGPPGYSVTGEFPSAHNVAANVVKTSHGNVITLGGEFRKMFLNFHQWSFPSGVFYIDQTWTQQYINNATGNGNPFASLMLGLADGGYITSEIATAAASSYFALYVQDDYQASPRLTFNLGLRWDADTPRTERFNHLSYWDPNLPSPLQGAVPASACPSCGNLRGQMEFVGSPGSKYGRRQGPTQWKDFGPRLGFAWSATNKTVLRGGWGIIYAPSPFQAAGATGTLGTQGFSNSTNFTFSYDNEQTIATTMSNPAPGGYNLPIGAAGGPSTNLGQSVTFYPTYNNPYTIQGNLNVQQVLPGNSVLEVGYVYSHGVHLIMPAVPYNQVDPKYLALGNQLFNQVPNPFYGLITAAGSPLSQPTIQENYLLTPYPQYTGVTAERTALGGAHYNSIIVQLDKRFSDGLSLLVAFTGAKNMSNTGGTVTYLGPTSQTYVNQYNPKAEYALSPFDVSHMLVTSFVYELPFGHGRRFLSHESGLTNALVSGWQANGIVTWDSGTPIVLGAANDQTGLFTGGQRPTEAPGDANLKHPTLAEWFNTSLFSQPAPFTFGNAPPTLPNVRTPGVQNADLSAFKNNYLGSKGQYNIQVRLESFNALNHPQFGTPDTGVNDGNFGQINSTANSPRAIQLAVKFIY